MTEPTNAKAAHVLSAKELLLKLEPSAILEKFLGTNSDVFKRSQCERILDGEPYRHYHEVYFTGPYTVKGIRDWLDIIESMEQELGEAIIDTDDDDEGIYALWIIEVPYTEEEVAAAQKWLDENPPTNNIIKIHTGENTNDQDY